MWIFLNIGLFAAVWKRPALTKRWAAHCVALREELAPDIELVLSMTGSEGETSRAHAVHPWHYAEAPNQPLGRKFNVAVGTLRNHHVDAVFHIGPDDFVSASLIRFLASRIESGCHFVGLLDCYMFNIATGEVALCAGYPRSHPRHGEELGAYRMISTEFLSRVNWTPWNSTKVAGPDGHSRKRLEVSAPDLWRTREAHHVRGVGSAIDVKDGLGKTPWNLLLRRGFHAPATVDEVFAEIPRTSITG